MKKSEKFTKTKDNFF